MRFHQKSSVSYRVKLGSITRLLKKRAVFHSTGKRSCEARFLCEGTDTPSSIEQWGWIGKEMIMLGKVRGGGEKGNGRQQKAAEAMG